MTARARPVSLTLLVLIVLVAGLSVWPASGQLESTSSAPPTAQRIRVTNPEVSRVLSEAGSRLVADYGGFQILDVTEATAGALASHEGVEVVQDQHLILLNTGPIDTLSPTARALRGPAGLFSGKRLHLIQFAGPVQESWLEAVKKSGVRVVTYIPFNAYLVYGDSTSVAQLQSEAKVSPFVQWDGPYLTAYKVHPRAQATADKESTPQTTIDEFTIQLVDDPPVNAATLALIDSLKLAPIRSQSRVLGYVNVIVRLPPSRLVDVAAQPDVVSIQLYSVPRLRDERQGQIMAGNISGVLPSGPGYLAWLASKGFTQAQFTASGFVVDLSDDGVDDGTTTPTHFGLYVDGNIAGQSRVAYVRREPAGAGEIRGCFGHGTLNAHVVAGYNNLSGFPHADTSGFRYGLGVAPFVKLGASVIFSPDFTSPDLEDLQSRAYADGARISSNSWGSDVVGVYDSDSQRYDALVRDAQPVGSAVAAAGNQQMVIVFSAGNAGPAAGSIGSPATGKNVLAVGASENVHPHTTASGGNNATGNDGCGAPDTAADSLHDMASFSSRGPAADGRVRPDLVAPGTHITGGVFQAAVPGPNGTADACFDATSVCALPGAGTAGDPDNFFPQGQQFYTTSSGTSHSTPAVAGGAALVRQWFINQGMSPASPAMTKAFLMNSARYLTGTGANDTLPSHGQGMGLMDLGRAFDGTPRIFRDQIDLFTATGQSVTVTGTISDPSRPFRVTLAWTDAPGSTVGNAFNNDLDLTVVVGGVVYKGNVFSGATSVPGGTADPRNNVESVFLPAGVTGPFAVIVRAANVNSDGVPNNASPLDQDFALVVYNAAAASLPVLTMESLAIVGGNAAVDPNECNNLDITLKNWGTASATGVSVTLATNVPGVALARPVAAYPNIAPAGTAAATTPFRIGTAAEFVCGTVIPLTATVTTNQGVQVLGAGLASGLPTPTNFPSADVPKVIPDLTTVESSVTVSGIVSPIEKVTVSVHLTHTFDGDLDISLVGPDGTIVDLSSDNGGTGENYGTSCGARAVFDDAGATSITAGAAPFVGTFRPEQALSAFAGKSGAAANGVWKLRVADDLQVDTGALQCWTLTITHSNSCSPGTSACSANRQRDFNADVKADILWRHDSGTLSIWLLNGFSLSGSGSPGGATTDWQVVGVGDFNGDGRTDILWRHTSGTLSLWLMNGLGAFSTGLFTGVGTDWQVAGVGDFNGDGKADILWRHTSGVVTVWFLNGLSVIGSGTISNAATDWQIAGVGDFNGDGKADILWRHTSGNLSLWLINGLSLIGTGSPGNVGNDWTIVRLGDFNGDGRADILWRHTSGSLAVWLLSGFNVIGTGIPGGADASWTVAGVGDLNGDGKTDVIWRHSSGLVHAWMFDGVNLIASGAIASVSNDWHIQ